MSKYVTDADGTLVENNGVMPYTGSAPLTVGTAYAPIPIRSVGVNATAAGNVALTLKDGSVIIIPVAVGWTVLPFSILSVNTSGTTATATYYALK